MTAQQEVNCQALHHKISDPSVRKSDCQRLPYLCEGLKPCRA